MVDPNLACLPRLADGARVYPILRPAPTAKESEEGLEPRQGSSTRKPQEATQTLQKLGSPNPLLRT